MEFILEEWWCHFQVCIMKFNMVTAVSISSSFKSIENPYVGVQSRRRLLLNKLRKIYHTCWSVWMNWWFSFWSEIWAIYRWYLNMGNVQLLHDHFSNNDFLGVGLRLLEVRFILKGLLGFYGRSKISEKWSWRSGVQPQICYSNVILERTNVCQDENGLTLRCILFVRN